MAELATVDEVGEPLSNNELFAILLKHCVIKSHVENHLAEDLTFPECLPDETVASIGVNLKARDDLLEEQRRQCLEETTRQA